MAATHERVNGSPHCPECGAVLDAETTVTTLPGYVLCTHCAQQERDDDEHDAAGQ